MPGETEAGSPKEQPPSREIKTEFAGLGSKFHSFSVLNARLRDGQADFREALIAVKEIAGDGERKSTEAFSGLQSHYLFVAKLGRSGKSNDKGNGEGAGGLRSA